ncbi:MAG: hypothetical protein M1829_001434 [Trizodia sp. TS-e1964]|nr:MAG: hypothetical protein M1829_001434 [Trizodia sp. TS-e1964]
MLKVHQAQSHPDEAVIRAIPNPAPACLPSPGDLDDDVNYNSFLNMDEEQDDISPAADDREEMSVSEGSNGEVPAGPTNNTPLGFTFDQLVDRLLAQAKTKSHLDFVSIFLCLYRKFAAPGDLLRAIVLRFEQINRSDRALLVRMTLQFGILNVVAQWVAGYPGDFAHPRTRQLLASFIEMLSQDRMLIVAAKELRNLFDSDADDDDAVWGYSDGNVERSNSTSVVLNTLTIAGFPGQPFPNSPADDEDTDEGPHSMMGAISVSRHSSGASSYQTSLTSIETSEREAIHFNPRRIIPLSKVQWHQFMEMPDEGIANELTRLDWIMFSSIRPRDLVRHVSMPVDQKEKCKSLRNVNRMIGHFNHLAYWVANMILLRDKPKHRAKALEKFMSIAWRLRYLNNYNTLGAVIAGVNGNAVHRLTQTRELVAPDAQKNFMRLEILMGTQRSHFAYRLAWENSSSERIPFIPLHRRDLVSAEEGNRTFLGPDGDRINWKKFEIMGDVIIGIQKSQSMPYPNITKNAEIQRLVLDSKFSNDEEAGPLRA